MTDLYAQAWFVGPDNKHGGRNRDAGACANNDQEVSRHKRNRHHCVTATGKAYVHTDGSKHGSDGDYIRFNATGEGHNPCKNLNGAKYIGGGRNGRGQQNDFAGRASNFGNAHVGLKCRLNNYTDASLRGWYQTNHIDKTGATGTRGDGGAPKKFRTFYEQLLFGIKTDAGTQRLGYCSNTANLMKEVGGGTCYAKIKSAINDADANNRAREWCKTNRSSPKCKCVNVQDGGTNFINHCKNKFKIGSNKNVRYIWYGFDNKREYLNIGQIEVYSGGKNIVKNIDDSKVTVNSQYDGTNYLKNQMFDGNYISMYHSGSGRVGRRHTYNWIKIDLGKDYTIDSVKIFNRHTCGSKEANNICDDRWSGSYVKLLDSSGNLISKSERIVGDHKENGERVKTFKAFVERDDGWAGCPEIVSAFKTFEDAGLTSASGLFGNSDCLVPGLCDGSGVIMPSSGKPNACANKLAICDQKVDADNIKAQNLLIEQGCEINFEADTKAADGQTVPPPPPPPSSSDPSSTPLKTSSSKNDDDDDDDEDEKELKIYEKPVFQIGTVASSSCSIFSCLILIMLTT
jgi:hypothetical protein